MTAEKDIKLTFYWEVAFFSFIFNTLLQLLVLPHIICPRMYSKYSEMTRSQRMEWDSRIVSTLHALIATVLSSYSLITEELLWTNKVWGVGNWAQITLAFSMGYFIADFIAMPFYLRGVEYLIYVAHHSISAFSFYCSINYQACQFFALFRNISEASTPFTNLRWMLKHLEYKKSSTIVVINSVVFALTFVLVRDCSIPLYWLNIYREFVSGHLAELFSMHTFLATVWIFNCLVLDVLNLNWTRRIVRGGMKMLRHIQEDSSSKKT